MRAGYPKLGRAWAIKEAAAKLWQPDAAELVRHRWRVWYGWAIRSRLEPIRRVARMVKRHLEGIVAAVIHRVSNARVESINALIQKIGRDARGFRNRERFRQAILFHLGGLDLYPEGVKR